MTEYFLALIEHRRRQPGNDLISNLLMAEIEGQKLSVAELLGFCSLLLVAGNETTTNLIGNAVLSFTEAPGTMERLRTEPSLLPQAIEEVLRYRSPVQSMYRVAAADTAVGEVQIPAGSPLVAWIGSANRDERQFRDPNNSTSAGRQTGTSPSAMASTSASVPRWPGSKPESRCRPFWTGSPD